MLIKNPKKIALSKLEELLKTKYKTKITKTIYKTKTLRIKHKTNKFVIIQDYDKNFKVLTQIPFFWNFFSTLFVFITMFIVILLSQNQKINVLFLLIVFVLLLLFLQFSYFAVFSKNIKEFKEDIFKIINKIS